MVKTCTKCGVEKPTEGFHFSKGGVNGRSSQCKVCHYAANKAWSEANPEKRRLTKARWQRANPDSIAAKNRRRRALKYPLQKQQHHTAADVQTLLEQQREGCAYCLLPLKGTYHVDHIVPLSRGGDDGPGNICLACASCNCSKGNRLLYTEWLPLTIGIFLANSS